MGHLKTILNKVPQERPKISFDILESIAIENDRGNILQSAGERKQKLPEFTRDQVFTFIK